MTSVLLPGPQPRSMMLAGESNRTRDTKSRHGRVRSSWNLRYCAESHSGIAFLHHNKLCFVDLSKGGPKVLRKLVLPAQRAPRHNREKGSTIEGLSTCASFAITNTGLYGCRRGHAGIGDRRKHRH